MRRQDKLKNIEKLNRRLNEDKFSWDGTYANELDEDDNDDYNHLYSLESDPDDKDQVDPYKIREKEGVDEIVVGLGDDIEMVDEGDGKPLDQPEPTDVSQSQWFSDDDGERIMAKQEN